MRIRKSVYQFKTICSNSFRACSNASKSGVGKEPLSVMPKPSRRDFIAIIFELAFRVPFMVLTGLKGLEFASQALLRRPKIATLGARVNFDRCAIPTSRFWLKTILRIVFLTPKPSRVQVLFFYNKKQKEPQTATLLVFGRGFKDLTEGAAHLLFARRPKFSRISVPASRFWLKTIHRIVFLTPKPSRVQVLFFYNKNKKSRKLRLFLFLAGAEGLEPSARGFGDRCSTN